MSLSADASTPSGGRHPDRLGARAGAAIVLAALAAIVFVTWYPYDFVAVAGPGEALRRVDVHLGGWLWSDVLLNILLFVPLGLGIAVWCDARAWTTSTVVAAAAGSGLVASGVVELVQASLLERDPAVSDVLANALGALVGAVVTIRWGDRIARRVGVVRRRFAALPEAPVAALFLLPALLILLLTAGRCAGADLPWDASYPMTLGNEATGDRPWSGIIESVAVVDADSLDDLPGGTDTVLFAYDGSGGVPSQGFEWRDGDGVVVPEGVAVGADGWLISEQPVARISEAVVAEDAVGLLVVASTASAAQFGPARIASISGDPYHRNVTVGQEGTSLVVRIRTGSTGANGNSPQLVVPDVFTDDAPHVVGVTSDGASVDVWVDGDRSSMRLVPEADVLAELLSPVGFEEMRISTGERAWVKFPEKNMKIFKNEERVY